MPRKPSGPRNLSSVMYKSQLEPCTQCELGYPAMGSQAKFRAVMYIEPTQCEPSCKGILGASMPRKPSGPRNLSSVMYKSQLEPCTQCELGYGHDGSKGSRG